MLDYVCVINFHIVIIIIIIIQGSDSGSSSPASVEGKRYRGGRQRRQKTPKSETNSDPVTPAAVESPCVEEAPLPVATSSPAAVSADHTPTSTKTRKSKNNEVCWRGMPAFSTDSISVC